MKEMKVINTSQEKQRDAYFDIVKSYAIFLVVLGHVIQMFNMKWESDNCFLAIYTFHMPLFIWISGHFFVHSVRKYSFAELLKKRFVQLMLPSMSMGIINFLIIGGGKLLKHEIIGCGYSLELIFTGLWFLVVLFILTMIGKFLYDKLDGTKCYFAWLVIWCLFYVLPDIWIFNEIEYLLPFFVGGIFCRNVNLQNTKWIGTAISFCVFIVCLHYFSFDKAMYNMGDNIFSKQYIEDTLLRLACGWSGIALSLYMVRALLGWFKNINWIAKVGMMTLPIYVLHQKIIMANRILKIQTDNIMTEAIIAIVVMTLTITIYRVLHKNKFIAIALFGENK